MNIVGPIQRIERDYGCVVAYNLAVKGGRDRERLLAEIALFESDFTRIRRPP